MVSSLCPPKRSTAAASIVGGTAGGRWTPLAVRGLEPAAADTAFMASLACTAQRTPIQCPPLHLDVRKGCSRGEGQTKGAVLSLRAARPPERHHLSVGGFAPDGLGDLRESN